MSSNLRDIEFIHKLPKVKLVTNREDFILSFCKGKNVLDLGCVRSGMTKESFYKEDLLHLKLLKVARNVVGVDIDKEGIDFLTELGISNLICLDVQELEKLNLDIRFDIIIAGELIEHLDNPGLFLRGVSRFMRPDNTILIITVPNAFSLRHFLAVILRSIELVMQDHNFYFSYTNLYSLLERHGFQILELLPYYNIEATSNRFKHWCKAILSQSIHRISPWSAEGLVVVANRP